jgi:heat shock protein HtpX
VKRIILFLATNMAILAVLSVSMRLLGIDQYMAATGQDPGALLVFAAILGFGGSLISLAMSKFMAKRSMGARVITQPRDARKPGWYATVRQQAQKAGIGMPEVAIFDSPGQPNAFATGARRDSAAGGGQHRASAAHAAQRGRGGAGPRDLARGQWRHGDPDPDPGGGEYLRDFPVAADRRFVDQVVFRSERGNGPGFFITVMVAQLVLGMLASMIVAWFSRQREFRADTGGAKLASRGNMVAALERLMQASSTDPLPEGMQAFGISGGVGRFGKLFMTHPPLPERIAALKSAAL